ncbi:MAG: hypothetical protein RIQ83_1965 [Pseudomonadota bacterium]|jgi:hypothetical protein
MSALMMVKHSACLPLVGMRAGAMESVTNDRVLP